MNLQHLIFLIAYVLWGLVVFLDPEWNNGVYWTYCTCRLIYLFLKVLYECKRVFLDAKTRFITSFYSIVESGLFNIVVKSESFDITLRLLWLFYDDLLDRTCCLIEASEVLVNCDIVLYVWSILGEVVCSRSL